MQFTSGTRHRLGTFAAIGVGCLAAGLLVMPAEAAYANSPEPTGRNNAITDVPGVQVGQYTNRHDATGTTDLIFPDGALVGSDPSGGSPGDRMASLFGPGKQTLFYTPVHGIILNGGSSFGLQAACGLVNYLKEHGLGQKLFGTNYIVPQVPGAIIFDLTRGKDYKANNTDVIPDTCRWGYRAAKAAKTGPVEEGSVGAGTGARSGGIKGGVGTASTKLDKGIVVGTLAVVNSGGKTYNVNDKCELYTAYLEQDNEFGRLRTPPRGCAPLSTSSQQSTKANVATGGVDTNTTIGVVATNAKLSPSQAIQFAKFASMGDTRAIRPSHMGGNGDTVYGVSTAKSHSGVDPQTFRQIIMAASDAYSRAIDHAILAAKNIGVAPTYCETFHGACRGAGHQSGQQGNHSTAAALSGGGQGPGSSGAGASGATPSSANWFATNSIAWYMIAPALLLLVGFACSRRWAVGRRIRHALVARAAVLASHH